MMAQKWDVEKQKYEPYELPGENCSLYEEDMDRIVTCAQCGEPMVYGLGYCSREVHTEVGLAYIVCERCYHMEWQRKAYVKKK